MFRRLQSLWKYKKGETLYWWGFSSTTRESRVLDSDDFFGASGDRTLFSLMTSATPEQIHALTALIQELTQTLKLLGDRVQQLERKKSKHS